MKNTFLDRQKFLGRMFNFDIFGEITKSFPYIFVIAVLDWHPIPAKTLMQCLSQDLETGCLKLAVGLDQVEVSI